LSNIAGEYGIIGACCWGCWGLNPGEGCTKGCKGNLGDVPPGRIPPLLELAKEDEGPKFGE
jgi:hypothetical protein